MRGRRSAVILVAALVLPWTAGAQEGTRVPPRPKLDPGADTNSAAVSGMPAVAAEHYQAFLAHAAQTDTRIAGVRDRVAALQSDTAAAGSPRQ